MIEGYDPTTVDLHTDPVRQRFRGYAKQHGMTPFDVPFISQIKGDLWQGGCEDGLVLPTFFKHLISLRPWESFKVNHQLESSLSIWMHDSVDQSLHQVDAIAGWVAECVEDGPTLVHCQAGLNRSGLVVARTLMMQGLFAADAIELIRLRRSDACLCNPAFEAHLRALGSENVRPQVNDAFMENE